MRLKPLPCRVFTDQPDVGAQALSTHVQGGCDLQGPEELSDAIMKAGDFMCIVGIDIAKRNHEAVIIDREGKVIVKAFRFSNSHEGFEKLLGAIQRAGIPLTQAVVGMEATGHYWLTLYTHLREKNMTVHVMNPIQSDALRGLYIRNSKTDAKDAFIIAEVVRFGRYTSTGVTDTDLLELRELCRHRFFLVDMTSDLKRKVIALLDLVFPEYESLFTNVFGTTSIQLLKEYTTPEEIAAIPTDKLCEILKASSRGRLCQERAEKIHDAAQNSFGILLMADTKALLIRQLLEQIQFVEHQIDDLDEIITQRLSVYETPLITISGIGTVLAAVILSEIGDISRFSSSVKLAAFAGVDPTLKQSGDFTGTRAVMSKRGSPYLRRAIWQAAFSSIRTDPAMHAFYDVKRSQGKVHSVAMGHLCRKLVNIIFAVLRDNKPYVPANFPSSPP